MTKPSLRGVALVAALLIALAALALPVVGTFSDPVGPVPEQGFESLRAESDYEASDSCRPCHPVQHASWHRTYHRTMTQEASESSIVAPFDGRELGHRGTTARAWRDGEAFVLTMPHPRTWTTTDFPIVRTVGSRRIQQYVTRIGDRHWRLPWAWSIEEGRWFHLSEAFFHPEARLHDHTVVWDLNCIFCHNVKARPGIRPDGSLESEVAELGIACEACHGPGEEHARRMRSPLRRYAFAATTEGDPTIVNPGRLDQQRSVEICAHCHGQRVPAVPERVQEIYAHGDPYTPGEDLSRYWKPIGRDMKVADLDFSQRFWKDGSPRLTAYEYQGLLQSPCFTDGDMTCLSCHAMHRGDPRGQVRPDRQGDEACLGCHAEYRGSAGLSHSRHPEGPGARCTACHMPPVVYGIMTWHPTHRVDVPAPEHAARHDKPDACTTCHAGRSRGWAVREVERLWGGDAEGVGAAAHLGDHSAEPPEMVHALFAGDAVYRTLAARRLREPAPEPEVERLAVPLLAEALLDPYPNVRRTARDSLERLTGRSDLPLANAPAAERRAVRDELVAPVAEPVAGWPFGADGELDRDRLARWIDERDDVPVHVGE